MKFVARRSKGESIEAFREHVASDKVAFFGRRCCPLKHHLVIPNNPKGLLNQSGRDLYGHASSISTPQ